MAKFKEGDWVYTYDEQGLVYKNQVRGNVGFLYLLTGRHEPINTEYVFKTKKECLKAMKDAGIQKASLHMATVIKLENKIADLEAKLAESEEKCEEFKQVISKCTGELPPNVAFDIANDDIRYQIVCNLTDRNQEHRNTIKQLKQQLAESGERVKGLAEELENVSSHYSFVRNKLAESYSQEDVDELKQKLVEKDEEIEKWKTKWCESETNSLRLYEQSQNNNQDKISFAVEQLERAKENLIEDLFDLYRRPCLIYETYGDEYDSAIQDAINNTIDNQIKQLTHQHEGKGE